MSEIVEAGNFKVGTLFDHEGCHRTKCKIRLKGVVNAVT